MNLKRNDVTEAGQWLLIVALVVVVAVLLALATGCAHTGFDRTGKCECVCDCIEETCSAECGIEKDSDYDFKVNQKKEKK